jgi:hypothetical protein
MQYFDNLPKLIYTDQNGVRTIRTDLLAHASIISNILKNPVLYYQYDIQDGDTPEIVAHKYYNDSYRYWIVLFANQMLDPQWDWPLSGNQFNDYLQSKYGDEDIYSTVHHYEKIITTYDQTTLTTTTNSVEIGVDEYNSLPLSSTTTYTLPTGPVSVTISGNAVSVYDYELQLNESKRTINLLNSLYVDEIEKEIKKLFK